MKLTLFAVVGLILTAVVGNALDANATPQLNSYKMSNAGYYIDRTTGELKMMVSLTQYLSSPYAPSLMWFLARNTNGTECDLGQVTSHFNDWNYFADDPDNFHIYFLGYETLTAPLSGTVTTTATYQKPFHQFSNLKGIPAGYYCPIAAVNNGPNVYPEHYIQEEYWVLRTTLNDANIPVFAPFYYAGDGITGDVVTEHVILTQPNGSNQLHVQFPSSLILKQVQITIYDVLGKRISTQSVPAESLDLDLTPFAQGTYTFVVETDQQTLKSRFIKQ